MSRDHSTIPRWWVDVKKRVMEVQWAADDSGLIEYRIRHMKKNVPVVAGKLGVESAPEETAAMMAALATKYGVGAIGVRPPQGPHGEDSRVEKVLSVMEKAVIGSRIGFVIGPRISEEDGKRFESFDTVLGNFKHLSGLNAEFENDAILFSKEQLRYAAQIYGLYISRCITLQQSPVEKNDPNFPAKITRSAEGYMLCLMTTEKPESKWVELPLEQSGTLKEGNLEEIVKLPHLIYHLRQAAGGGYDFFLAGGDTAKEAERGLEDHLMQELTEWVNQTRGIGFIVDAINADPDEAEQVAAKHQTPTVEFD